MSERIFFNNVNYFGDFKKLRRKGDYCTLMNLLLKGLVNFDGSVDETVALSTNVNKGELWFYIWYLWKHNHQNIDLLRSMSTDKDIHQASAESFVLSVKSKYNSNVKDYLVNSNPSFNGVKKEELISFINRWVFEMYEDKLVLPELTELFRKLELRLAQKEMKLKRGIVATNSKISDAIDKLEKNTGIKVSVVTGSSQLNSRFGAI
jgi:hypothetical protein